MSNFQDYVGMKIKYRSGSNKEYDAIITAIPDRPDNVTQHPTVSLIFENNRGKWIKKERVLPLGAGSSTVQVWLYTEGKHLWKNGLFVFDD